MYAACLYGDLPYGYNLFPYDKQETVEGLIGKLKQFDAIQDADNYVVILWHKPMDTHIINEALKNRNIVHTSHMFWHKKDHIVMNQPTNRLVNSTEMGTIGYVPDMNKANFLNPNQDPKKRHNTISLPSVSKLAKNESGDPINVTEKPIKLGRWLLSTFCRPGSTILNVGCGAGGDIMAAIHAKLNVIAVEKDIEQFNALRIHLKNKASEYDQAWEKGISMQRLIEGEMKSSKQQKSSSSNETATATSSSLSESLQQEPAVSPTKGRDRPCLQCGDTLGKKVEVRYCGVCTDGPFHTDCVYTYEDDSGTEEYVCQACHDNEGTEVPETQNQN